MINRRTIFKGGAGAAALATVGGLAKPALAQGAGGGAGVLRFVPQANLANPDPIWTTATVAINHGYMVWDTLFGVDDSYTPRPQMCAGSEVSSDGLTWTFTLRDGLMFTDGVPVRGADCVQSIKRWSVKDPFGQYLASITDEMAAPSDKTFTIRLKKPFGQMLYALGAQNCFIMPERMAKTPASEQVKEFIGSGPFIFQLGEWVSGVRAVYTKNTKYVPRQEAPQYLSGGKVVNFDRVEWIVQTDPATASGALQRGEVDWLEQPIADLLPQLRGMKDLVVENFDPLGNPAVLAMNHLYPPFDNPLMCRALMQVVNQSDFMTAIVGDQKELMKVPMGIFTPGSPMANTVGIEAVSGPRDVAKAKQMVKDAGYKGEPIVLMGPTDQPALNQMVLVADAMLKSIGVNSQYTAMDWGTLVSRRASQAAPDKGGWNIFITSWNGLAMANPGSSYPLRANGKTSGWFGWPTDPKLEQYRLDWMSAPDLAAQKKVCEQVQAESWINPPFLPLGVYYQPTAYRRNLSGFVKNGQKVFWGIKRA